MNRVNIYNKAIENETHFNVGDKVRYITNKNLFEKGATAKWSKTVNTIAKSGEHSYLLNNGHVAKYYELQLVPVVETKVIERKRKEPTIEDLSKEKSIKRKPRKEGLELERIIPVRLRSQVYSRI